jgi:TRAP-type C4-dicarboxylate transport system permease small subunit
MLVRKIFAQVNIGESYKVGDEGISSVFHSFGEFFQHLLSPIYIFAGIIMLFLLIFGGFSVIIGAGKEDSGQIQKGQKAITAAVIGFIIIIGSYFIIKLIEVVTGVNILESGL